MVRPFLILILFIICNGCQTVFKPSLIEALSTGMTSIQVREMLGDPAYISTSKTNTIYGYTYNMPIRNRSTLFEWEQERLLSSQSHSDFFTNQRSFEIIFFNDKLISYRELH